MVRIDINDTELTTTAYDFHMQVLDYVKNNNLLHYVSKAPTFHKYGIVIKNMDDKVLTDLENYICVNNKDSVYVRINVIYWKLRRL